MSGALATANSVSAQWLYTGRCWLRDARVTWDATTGRIVSVDDGDPCADAHEVIAPAFHNAHAHAFQWSMRGHAQTRSAHRTDDDFWTWRETMYAHAGALTPDRAEQVATAAYRAMVRRGFASVGEFLYVHHAPDGSPYADGPRIAAAHARAARHVGIHLVLIPVAYARAGTGRGPEGAQKRFSFASPAEYFRYVDSILSVVCGPGVTCLMGAHSVRAVDASWLAEIASEAQRRSLNLHIHASEQRAELEQSVSENGLTPIALLDEVGFLTASTTIVHATHATSDEIERMRRANAVVCVCPTTERDLGDGFAPVRALREAGVDLCIGSDANLWTDPVEEMRLVELHERLRTERRVVLPGASTARLSTLLMDIGARAGARSLGLHSGIIERDARADLVAWSADETYLDVGVANPHQGADSQDTPPTDALDRWIFAQDCGRVTKTWVAGRAAD